MTSATAQVCIQRLVCTCVCFIVISLFGCGSLAQEAGGASQEVSPALIVNQPQKRELATDETHVYSLPATKSQYIRVLIYPTNSDLHVNIQTPDGQKLVETYTRRFGVTPLSLITRQPGDYRIIIKPRHTTRTLQYIITLESLRNRTPADVDIATAESSAAEAEFLRASERSDTKAIAIRNFKQALRVWQTQRRLPEQAVTLKSIGELYYALGQYAEAVNYLEQAVALRAAVAGTEIEAELLNSFGYALLGAGVNERALENCTEALKLFQALHSEKGIAQALTNLGEVHYGLSNLEQSVSYLKEALALWEKVGDLRGQADALLELGSTYSLLRDSSKSLDSLERALGLWKTMRDPRGEAFTLTAMGAQYTRSGEWQKAGTAYDQALTFFEAAGDVLGRARLYNALGYLNVEAGKKEEALRLHRRALSLFEMMGRLTAVAGTRLLVGELSLDVGDRKQALNDFEEALALAKKQNDPLMEAYAVFYIGTAHSSTNQRVALDKYFLALTLFQRAGDRLCEARAHNSIGSLYAAMGQAENALQHLEIALRIGRAINIPREIALTLHGIAMIRRNNGDLAAAKSSIEEALSLNERLRTKASREDLRTSYFASVNQQFQFYIDLLMTLNKQNPNKGYDRLALEASERARARTFVETLVESQASIREGVDITLLEQERKASKSLSELVDRQVRLAGPNHRDELKAVEKRIEDLTTELEQIESRIKVASSRYATLTQPAPLTAKSLQELLDEDTLLLEYSLGDERSFIWAVTADSITSFEIPGRATIERIARRMYEATSHDVGRRQREILNQQAESQFQTDTRALSDILLKPIASLLGHKRLAVAADGILQYIPFGALPDPRSVDMDPILAKHEVVNLPSASVLAVQRRNTSQSAAPLTLALIADPVFDLTDPRTTGLPNRRSSRATRQLPISQGTTRALREVGMNDQTGVIPRLPYSRREADAIFAVVPRDTAMKALDFAASRETAMSGELAKYRIVHFATHGLLNNEHPELSGILLSMFDQKGVPQNGFLPLHEIYSLNLPADLVVLSACQTALGKNVKGEGLIGLTRGFMSAGAKRVVATLWKVDDEATADLMGEFYRQMFVNNKRPPEALKEAQLYISKQKRWRAPYYWAGFVLQGEWR